jgi:hypothetical protein
LSVQPDAREETAEDQQRRYASKHLCVFFSDDPQHQFVVQMLSTQEQSSSTAIISRASPDHQE